MGESARGGGRAHTGVCLVSGLVLLELLVRFGRPSMFKSKFQSTLPLSSAPCLRLLDSDRGAPLLVIVAV
jgi:hypothetical protein